METILHTEPITAETSQVINVVLAEDDPDDVLIFRLALNELNIAFKLDHAENGENLLALLKQLLPDIIFLDINLPYKDGLSCLIEIRKNSNFDNVPVVLISGHRFQKYINDGFMNGANYYLIKANDIGQLADYLRSIFSIDWKKVMYYPPMNQFVIGNIEGAG
jgi:DNA-binding response OmpR family regulator